ncbi:hypothetical protein ACIGXA_33975 [Streptomyces fildesensis]|uniref:Integral membrane protein n=1 Tax=Streptomyces fildesensis TaxID=375757 RepID=A0ABW8CJH1_9ACTN
MTAEIRNGVDYQMLAGIRRGRRLLAWSIAFVWCLDVAITGRGSMRVCGTVMALAIAADATRFIRAHVQPWVKRRQGAQESDA